MGRTSKVPHQPEGENQASGDSAACLLWLWWFRAISTTGGGG